MIEITVEPLNWNYKLSEVAQEDFAQIRNTLPYCVAQSIGLALAKFNVLWHLFSGIDYYRSYKYLYNLV